ncbi:MAG TPA: hypothetical protein VNO55_28890 [Polyangia bacterium]|nr:hypothetical protein [Polyangia bacterium]
MKPTKRTRNGSGGGSGNGMMLAAALAAGWLAPAVGCMSSDDAEPACAPASGRICSIAGTGIPGDGADDKPALATKLYLPQDVTIGPDGRPFIVDWNNHRIRVLQPDGTLHIVAGVGELGLSSDDPASGRLNHPTGVAFDQDGKLVIAAWHNSRIKMADDLINGTLIDTCGNGQRAFSGDGGPASAAALNLPVSVVFDQSWNMIIADQANQRLRKVDHVTGVIETIAGNDPCPADQPCDIGDAGPATAAHFAFPPGQAARPGGRIDLDAAGNLYVADTSHFRVRRIDPNGVITTVAGNGTVGFSGDGGPAKLAQLSRITDVAAGPDGNLYIADNENSCIRMVDQDGNISTVVGRGGQQGFAGDGGPVSEALLNRPYGIAFDPQGNLYIADTHNNRIRVVYR